MLEVTAGKSYIFVSPDKEYLRSWLSPHRGVSKDKLTPYLRAFQLRGEVFRKPGEEAPETILETVF